MGIENIVFLIALVVGVGLFARKSGKILRNIRLGREEDRSDRKMERLGVMARVALGQGKMVVRPVAGFLHILIYVGFVIINIEVLEIVIDGIFGTHRVLSFLGGFYDLMIGLFEWLALGVVIACVAFLVRRLVLRIPRFWSAEMTAWPRRDAVYILVIELILMGAFLKMNAADQVLQMRGVEHYPQVGYYPISSFLVPFFATMETGTVIFYERLFWWAHILGILAFLNYLPYSKHYHILLAFPNTYFSNLGSSTKLRNMEQVTREVKLMMDPAADPYAAPPADAPPPSRFGAKDAMDLSWKSLLDAYTCTECGRCTSECPANLTGKLLSPRKIMMDTRDRIEEVGRNIDSNDGAFKDDGRSLLGTYITEEELWACTTCNACTQACPVNIDPVGIIMELRRDLVMEQSRPRPALTAMLTNVENNGAPWQFAQADRMKWTQDPEP